MREMFSMNECPHRPACPGGTSRWICGQRTRTEAAVNRGLIDRGAAQRLLAKYGVPMTPASKVYKGQPPEKPQAGLYD